MAGTTIRGIVFAYDEAQNLSDHAVTDEYPVSLLLDVFSYFQRTLENCHFILVPSGLPTLFPQLNAARTYTERMFHVMYLERLSEPDARDAIQKPIEITRSPLRFAEKTIDSIISSCQMAIHISYSSPVRKCSIHGSVGYRMGLRRQYRCQQITEKLDQEFFAPRWQRATDRQQDFMKVIATLESGDDEFSVQEIVAASKDALKKGFSPSHTAQMLGALAEKGLVYRTRRGGYSFAVPLLAQFIRRQTWNPSSRRVPLSS